MTDYTITCHQQQASSASALDPRYVRRLTPDPAGGYTATIHELPGCIAEGDTAEEALAQLESVAQSWMESAMANGYPISPPVDYDGASGKVALRISRRLHQLAAERADLEGVSLNQFIGNALASYIGQQDGMRRMAQELETALSKSLSAAYVQISQSKLLREKSSSRFFIAQTKYISHVATTDMTLSPMLPNKSQFAAH